MLGSTVMNEALKNEKNNGNFSSYIKKLEEDPNTKVYFALGSAGVANNAEKNDSGWVTGGTSNNNGRCYEVRLNPDNTKNKNNILLMQSINTSLPNAFDIFQSGGGAGAFPDNGNGMNSFMWNIDFYPGSDGNPTKKGGRTVNIQDSWLCKGMYDNQSSWDTWSQENGEPTPNTVREACELYYKGAENNRFANSEEAYKSLIDSCETGVESLISCPKDSNNHKGSHWRAIECPTYLTKVSGLRLKNKPPNKPHPNTVTDLEDHLKFTKPCDSNNNAPGCFYNTTDFGPNVVGGPTGLFNSALEVTQMQDGRSPDAAQCFEMPKNTVFESGYESVWNYNTNGELIKNSTNTGCFNLPYVNTNPISNIETFAEVDFKDKISSIPGNWTTDLDKTFDRWSCDQPYLPVKCPPVFPDGCDTCILEQNKSTCDNMVTATDSIKSCLVADTTKHCDKCINNQCYYADTNASTKEKEYKLLINSADEVTEWGVKPGPIPCVNMKLDYCWNDDAKNLSSSYENNPECWDKDLYEKAYQISAPEKDKQILSSMNQAECAGVKQICNYNDCAWSYNQTEGKMDWNPNINTVDDYCSVCKNRDSAQNRSDYIDLTDPTTKDKNFSTIKSNYKSKGNVEALCPKDIMASPVEPCPSTLNSLQSNDSNGCVKVWNKCGGGSYSEPENCCAGNVCTYVNEYYSQCQPSSPPGPPGPPGPPPSPGSKCGTQLPDSCGSRVVKKPTDPDCFYSNGIIKPECANKCTITKFNDPETYGISKCFRKPAVPTNGP